MAELKRYSGRSLEEAMGKVNEALGPGAEIVEAKRVRRGGVLGVMKRDVVEVVAKPRPARAPGAERARGAGGDRPRNAGQGRGAERELGADRTRGATRGRAGDLASDLDLRDELELGCERGLGSSLGLGAAPASRGARPSGRAARRAEFSDQLSSLIDEVDLREDRQLLQRPTTTAAAPRSGRRFTDDDLAPLAPEPQARRASRPAAAPRRDGATPRPRTAARPGAGGPGASPGGAAAPRPGAAPRRSGLRDPARPYAPAAAAASAATLDDLDHARTVEHATSSPATRPPVDNAPVRAAAPAASSSQEIDLRERRYGPAWSEEALRDLGLPEVVIELIPVAVLRGDLEWTVALEAAIRASVPAPTMPVAMCGYGAHSAVKILESMLGGCAMGEMRLQDRSVMATPFEIALAVRQCLSQ